MRRVIKIWVISLLVVSLSSQIAYAGYWRNKLSGASSLLSGLSTNRLGTAATNFANKHPKATNLIGMGITSGIMGAKGAASLGNRISTFANNHPIATKLAVGTFAVSPFGIGIAGGIMGAKGAAQLRTRISTFAGNHPKATKFARGAFAASPLGMGIRGITRLRGQTETMRRLEGKRIPINNSRLNNSSIDFNNPQLRDAIRLYDYSENMKTRDYLDQTK